MTLRSAADRPTWGLALWSPAEHEAPWLPINNSESETKKNPEVTHPVDMLIMTNGQT